jgi:beta-lactam-binding protein with PASTA domain
VLVFTGLAAVRYFEVGELPLPDLLGVEAGQATALLAEHNLQAVTFSESISAAKAGTVTSQTPPPGTIVRQGRTVSLGVYAPPEDARAPHLVGLTIDQALRTTFNENLTLDLIEYAHDEAPSGQVIAQEPGTGLEIDPATGLRVVVSRGPELPPVAMPDVRGLLLAEAQQRLGAMGFTSVQRAATGTSFDRPGTVTGQQPAAGDVVPRSTPVTLSYALAASEVVQVPAVAGQSPLRVQMLLRSVGLQVGPIEYVDEPSVAAGAVVRTEPAAYTLHGTPVKLYVNGTASTTPVELDREPLRTGLPADRPAPRPEIFPEGEFGSRSVPVTFDPAQMGSRALLERPYNLRFVVDDDRGERIILDRTVPAGEAVSTVVVVYGDALLQTYINDIFFQAWRP